MFDFHHNKDHYFGMQKWVTSEYVIPFIEDQFPTGKQLSVLEIGCAEAGVLGAFLEKGHIGVGIELNPNRVKKAKEFLKDAIEQGKVKILNHNIYDVDPSVESSLRFDLIVLKDVIEHIPNQEKFIPVLRQFLNADGKIFFGYPPWWMPFGGHQQICKSKFLSMLPWYHLLPTFLYRGILKMFNEPKHVISELIEIKETGIIIERLYKILKQENYKIIKEKFWFINPIYKKKFGLNPSTQIFNIPYLRNVISTCHYIVFQPR